MEWKNITVEQYQQAAIIKCSDADPLEQEVQLMCLFFDMTQKQVLDLTIEEANKLAAKIKFIHTPIPEGEPREFIKANGKCYFINYKVEKHRFGQYIEEVSFSPKTTKPDEYVANLHLLMASIVQPVVKKFGFRKVLPNRSEQHEERANDMLKAKFVDLYNACLFFCRVYKGLMTAMRDYLVLSMEAKGIARKEAEKILETSIHAMDGSITPKWFPTLKLSV